MCEAGVGVPEPPLRCGVSTSAEDAAVKPFFHLCCRSRAGPGFQCNTTTIPLFLRAGGEKIGIHGRRGVSDRQLGTRAGRSGG